MKKAIRWIALTGVVVFALLQFTNPTRTNPAMTPGHDLFATNAPPADIGSMLRKSCYDCHSVETTWPWYSRVAPMSWGVVDHVNKGRKRLNLSDWPHDDPKRAAKLWSRVADQVSSGDMPLASYLWIHRDAKLTAEQRDRLSKWAEQEADRLRSSAGPAEQK